MKMWAGTLLAVMVCGVAARALPAQQAPKATADVKVWTSDVVSDERSRNAVKAIRPVTLIGARNGTFSGKIVVESPAVLKGVQANIGPLSGPGGTIPPQNVQLRYAQAPEIVGWYTPWGLDTLLESSPSEVVRGRYPAMIPVWVTVRVPKDATAGSYAAEVTVQPSGGAAVKVPVTLEVVDWTLPDPQDYRTWLDFVQSPDTLALEYKVPLWSDEHWKLIDRSFQLLSPSGGRTLYVPLICRTNLGNEQSMVRWVSKGDGQYDHDFTIFDKYLDSAQKNLGQPKLVILQVWDICMSERSLKRGLWTDKQGGATVREARTELLGKGPRLTVWDPATNEANMLTLPQYEDPASKALWQRLFTEIRTRLAQRGLEKTMLLGLMSDLLPDKDEVAFWKDVSGGLPWAIHSHGALPLTALVPRRKGLHKISDVAYAAYVGRVEFNVNPEKGRLYGWRSPTLFASYLRGGELNRYSTLDVREYPVFNITGGQRGGGRLGADFWQVVRDKRGRRVGAVYGRYPENNWRNLDIHDWFLAPGPTGPVATARLECLKEGVQECEARILLEEALLDADKKAKLGEELAQHCQDALDEHHRAMWKTVWNVQDDLKALGRVTSLGRSPSEGLWNALRKVRKDLPTYFTGEGQKMRREASVQGREWFAKGWLEREKKLFQLAGEVTRKLGTR